MTGDALTIAESIADRFGNDGQNFTDEGGIEIDVVLVQTALEVCAYDTSSSADGAHVYRFRDGSALVTCDSYWDVLERVEGVTVRAHELHGDALTERDLARIDATWQDGGGEVWALETLGGDLLNPRDGRFI
jgi:hypothetical protein